MKYLEWPRGPILLLTISIIVFALPDPWEGQVLFNISNGHGLSLIDFIALIPLLISATWIQKGLWKRRIFLFNKITMYPGSASLIIFFIGLGLGLLIASAFNDFFYWWAVGGVLFIILIINVVLISERMKD